MQFIVFFSSRQQPQMLRVQQPQRPLLQRPLQLDHAAQGQELRRLLRQNGAGDWNA